MGLYKTEAIDTVKRQHTECEEMPANFSSFWRLIVNNQTCDSKISTAEKTLTKSDENHM